MHRTSLLADARRIFSYRRQERRVPLLAIFATVGLVTTAIFTLRDARQGPNPHDAAEISLTKGLGLLAAKEAIAVQQEISDVHPTRVVILTLKNGTKFFFRSTFAPSFEKAVEESGADVTITNDDTASQLANIMSLIGSAVIIVLFGGTFLFQIRKFFSNPARIVRAGKNAIGFADVAGQKEAKDSLQEIVAILKSPEKYADIGARVPAGILLVGEPGNGKTLLARATAKEAGVSFLYCAASDVLEIFGGLGARRIRGMFRTARRQRGGCILFIDEFETIAGRRGAGAGSDISSEKEQILTALLTELDGLEARRGIVLIAATNRPDMLDPAITRPGRIDRTIVVAAPDATDIETLLDIHTRKIPLAAGVDLNYVARLVPGFSGAQTANLANEAALEAKRRGLSHVDDACFHAARDAILMGQPRSIATYHKDEIETCCTHEAGHAIAASVLPECDPIHRASILPRGRSLGQVFQIPEFDRHMHTKTRMQSLLIVLMAGRAAERMTYGDEPITTGAEQDIAEATRLARSMIGKFGMHPKMGEMDYFGDERGRGAASPPTLQVLDAAVKTSLDTAYNEAFSLLLKHRDAHSAIAAALRSRHTLTRQEIADLVAAHAPVARASVEATRFQPEFSPERTKSVAFVFRLVTGYVGSNGVKNHGGSDRENT